jgi:ribonucleotide reductase alpha subunit
MDLLMLGGGVGMSVEHRYTSRLPKVRQGVRIEHRNTKDADFIVPDSREGWVELVRRTLESMFVTGRSFSFSTICVRPGGDPIIGFGGTASGPRPLIDCVEKIHTILSTRAGRHVRPIDAADLLCCIGEMVVAGNVRRSAIIILGDPWDREYLTAKRWDLGGIPTYRAMANFSVVASDVDELHPLFWKTYESGEPFGVVNRKAMQTFGRIGELKSDSGALVNPCVPAGTEILTDGGYREISSLVGQTVNVWNGFEFSPVQPQVTGHDQKLVRVTLSSGQSIVCTLAHRFWVQDGYRSAPRFMDAKDLVEGTMLAKTELPVVHHGDAMDLMVAYTNGFYSGDGDSVSGNIMLYGDKVALFPHLAGTLGQYDQKQDRANLSVNFKMKGKTWVPFGLDSAGRLAWFAGLLDSDGTRLKEGGSQICSVDRGFLLATQKMLTTLGITSKVVPGRAAGARLMPDGNGGKKEYHCQDLWRLCVGSTQMQDLLSIGLTCHRLDFKAKPQRDASRFVTVVSIEDAGVADTVYCFKEGLRGLGCFEGIVTGQCAEATLEAYEPCNLQEIALPNLDGVEEFVEGARLMHRWGKRVTCEKYHWPQADEVVKRNRRIGTGITGCLQSPLFAPEHLDRAYAAIQQENREYSKELGIPESIRTTVVKPSGTMSKVMDVYEGIHPAYSRHYIQRVRFAASDPLIPLLRAAGHHIEPQIRFDGSLDHNTVVVDFYCRAPDGAPVADEDWDTWKQLDVVKTATKHWADQAVSVTVYYRREDLPRLKEWLAENLPTLKTISFLCHSEHGFIQAPKEAITKEQYDALSSVIKPLDEEAIGGGDLESLECAGGACPIK